MMNERLLAIGNYGFAFIWGLIVIVSFTGWGSAVNRVLLKDRETDWGHRACWGIAFSVLVGGVLNLTGTISKTVICIFLVAGLLLWMAHAFQTGKSKTTEISQFANECKTDKLLLIGSTLVFFLLLLRYAGSIVTPYFNPHDDYHAYFVVPARMLQIGSAGIDHFLGRQFTALGGQSFLDAFILTALSWQNLNMADAGIGLIVAAGVLWGLFRKGAGLTYRQSIFLLAIFLAMKTGKVNISSCIVALALFTSLYRTLRIDASERKVSWAKSCTVGLVASALCALKSSLILPTVLLLALAYLFDATAASKKKTVLYGALLSLAVTAALLLPWMISLHQSLGTFLYPFLGRGFEGSVNGGTYLSPTSGLTLSGSLLILGKAVTSIDFLVLGLLSFGAIKLKPESRRSLAPLLIATILGALALCLAVGGHNINKYGISNRYAIAFMVPAIFILMAMLMQDKKPEGPTPQARYSSALIAVFAAGLLLGGLGDGAMIKTNLANIRTGLGGFKLVQPKEGRQYRKLLGAAPPGEKVLARVEKPFLLDFKRNRIFIVDMPGWASLPPGMPFFKGAGRLDEYLRSWSIRYVAYSYGCEAGFSKKEYGWMLDPDKASLWYLNDARHTFDFQDNLTALGKTRKRIYDDGQVFVLDLGAPNGQGQD